MALWVSSSPSCWASSSPLLPSEGRRTPGTICSHPIGTDSVGKSDCALLDSWPAFYLDGPSTSGNFEDSEQANQKTLERRRVAHEKTPIHVPAVPNGVDNKQAYFAFVTTYLKRCSEVKALFDGRRLHARMSRYGYDRNTFLGNCLIRMYGNCGSVEDAQAVFDNIDRPHLYSWNILITAYTQNGNLDNARVVFDRMPQRDVVSWSAIIGAYAQRGNGKKAVDLFIEMQVDGVQPNQITFLSLIDGCASMAPEEGKKVHSMIVARGFEQNLLLGCALVNMYGKCGNVNSARNVFGRMQERDVVSWNAMLTVCAQNDQGREVLKLFRQMQFEGIKPDRITFISVLDACASLAALQKGKEIHAVISYSDFENDVVVGNALVNMYGKCGSLHNSWSVFRNMESRDVVSWSAMTAACAHNGHGKEALDIFSQMQNEGVYPDKVAFICALDVCASLAALEKGQEIHASIICNGSEQDDVVWSVLLNMYGKCGSMDAARIVFCRMPQRDVFAWTAMIAACSQNGFSKEALNVFSQMQCEGVTPNKVTFICVLSACNHIGRLEEARHYFFSMKRDYGIVHSVDHYVCMIDLLGRAGHLEEAEDLINTMPFQNVSSGWSSLLAASRNHGDAERGLRAAKSYLDLDPKSALPYIMLSNICAATGRNDDLANLQEAL